MKIKTTHISGKLKSRKQYEKKKEFVDSLMQQ
jgi:hypothetical protein